MPGLTASRRSRLERVRGGGNEQGGLVVCPLLPSEGKHWPSRHQGKVLSAGEKTDFQIYDGGIKYLANLGSGDPSDSSERLSWQVTLTSLTDLKMGWLDSGMGLTD